MRDTILFPKTKYKKRQKRHPPSIIRQEPGVCWLCALNGDRRIKTLHKHHVYFGHGLRLISEENGFTINLCINHHTEGKEAVHRNKETREYLCRLFQRKFEETHSREEFMKLVGKNYL